MDLRAIQCHSYRNFQFFTIHRIKAQRSGFDSDKEEQGSGWCLFAAGTKWRRSKADFAYLSRPCFSRIKAQCSGFDSDKEEQGSRADGAFFAAGIKRRRSKAGFAPTPWRSSRDLNPGGAVNTLRDFEFYRRLLLTWFLLSVSVSLVCPQTRIKSGLFEKSAHKY